MACPLQENCIGKHKAGGAVGGNLALQFIEVITQFFDNWLTKTSEDKLSPRAAKLKREIAKKAKSAAA